jgi:mannose-6-phosphate isomerase-like protein (cupin superfamily)
MDAWELDELVARLDTSGHDYAEFFRAPTGTLSMTIAFWPAGGEDPQTPHTEDEVYYVGSGRGKIDVAGETRDVAPGSVVYVAAGVEHRFHSIEEDLRVVVFWAPPRARGRNSTANAV